MNVKQFGSKNTVSEVLQGLIYGIDVSLPVWMDTQLNSLRSRASSSEVKSHASAHLVCTNLVSRAVQTPLYVSLAVLGVSCFLHSFLTTNKEERWDWIRPF